MTHTKPDEWYDKPVDPYSYPSPEYHPEYYRLTIIDVIGGYESYEFDTTILWKHENGTFWIAHDSGCSCPVPFDGFDFDDGLDQVHTLSDVEAVLDTLSRSSATMADIIDMLRKAEAAGVPR